MWGDGMHGALEEGDMVSANWYRIRGLWVGLVASLVHSTQLTLNIERFWTFRFY